MEFEQRIAVTASPDKVWALLWDINRMASCIPGCKEAREVEPHRRYTAVVAERVGPFKVQFPLEILVQDAEEGRRLRALATGKDTAVGSSLKMQLDLEITQDGGQTVLTLRADVNVLGKLGTLGHSMFKRKAGEVMGQFAGAMRHELEKTS